MSEQRIESIDIVKGLAIFLMVLGHSYSGENGEYILLWIYSFHMPLFFITTGILYGMRKNSVIKFNIKKKLKTILWPYLFWGTTYQLFVGGLKVIGGAPLVETMTTNLLYVIQLTGSAMWFLPVMFGSLIMAQLIFTTVHKKTFYILLSLTIMMVSIMFTTHNEFFAIILKIAIGAGFVSIGYCFAALYNKNISLQGLIVLSIGHIFLASLNSSVSLAGLVFGNPILYIITSCVGTLVVYGWCQKIRNGSPIAIFLAKLGRNSLKILCLHGFIIQIIRLFDYKVFGDFLSTLGNGEGVVLSLIIISILSFMLEKRNRFVDWTFGM